MRSTTTLLLLAGSIAGLSRGVLGLADLCFFPGGVQSHDVPCDPLAQVSMCCGSINACLSNGLCKLDGTSNDTGIGYARGTCSDPTWQSPICPQHCILNQDTRTNRSAYDFRFNGVQVWQCDSQGFARPGKFCCESAAEKTRCCSTSTAVFGPLIAATPGNAAPVQNLALTTSKPPASTRKPTTSHASATQTAAPTIIASKISATPAPATGQPTGGPGPDGDDNNQTNGGLSTVAVVGLAIGASVGGALLVAFGVLWWMRNERMQRGAVELDASSMHGGGGGPGGDMSRSNTMRTAYGGVVPPGPPGPPGYGTGTDTMSSMDMATKGVYEMSPSGKSAESDWDGSPGGSIHQAYPMAEIDGKETLVVMQPPRERKKSLYELA